MITQLALFTYRKPPTVPQRFKKPIEMNKKIIGRSANCTNKNNRAVFIVEMNDINSLSQNEITNIACFVL